MMNIALHPDDCKSRGLYLNNTMLPAKSMEDFTRRVDAIIPIRLPRPERDLAVRDSLFGLNAVFCQEHGEGIH
jgi:hypothetical protein